MEEVEMFSAALQGGDGAVVDPFSEVDAGVGVALNLLVEGVVVEVVVDGFGE